MVSLPIAATQATLEPDMTPNTSQAAMVDRRIVTTKPKDRPHKKGQALKEEAHYVYRRQGRPCFISGTKILTEVMAGRNLFWCPVCQAAA